MTDIALENLGVEIGDTVYISPYTPVSEKLKRQIVQIEGVEFLGFIDNSKLGENIIKPNQAGANQCSKVLIISPNYGIEIFKQLKKLEISRAKLTLLTFDGAFKRESLLRLRWRKFKDNLLPNLHLFLQRNIQKYVQRSDTVLFLSQEFVDLNIKQLYLFFKQNSSLKAIIATDNKRQLMHLRSLGFEVVDINSLQFIFYSLRAKLKILDHTPITKDLQYSIRGSKTIQIWHGIPLKKIGHLANYRITEYDLLVSTSDFVTEYAFSKVFNYKKIVNAGYPRNDMLINRSECPKKLAMVEKNIYQWLSATNKKYVVYMPTWRGDSFDSNPIDLDLLNDFAKKHGIIILIKMHPFIRLESFFDTLESDRYQFKQGYQDHVIFYPSTHDIYPLLANSSVLITDYSSIYFDYLLINKPILFFVYDKEAYVKRHGDFMLDFDEFTPGLKPTDMLSLFECILASLQCDEYQLQRKELVNMLYQRENIGHSSTVIFNEAITLLTN